MGAVVKALCPGFEVSNSQNFTVPQTVLHVKTAQ